MTLEKKLRRSLGIPDDAEKVLIFTESSHWDPNWLYTSKEYFKRFVQKNLDMAIGELQKEPRRVYSVENVFFLKMYWDHNPGKRDAPRDLINEGRLRLMSSAVTSADTILPRVEAILRDMLIGQEWLRSNGIAREPKLAYFPDSFGSSPFLPSLLNAAGFDRTAITRLDGMYFPGCDLEPKWRFPRPGSSAELLLKKERSLDFVWRDKNGGEVLAHWNAFTYGQGDMLAYLGISRVYLAKLAISLRTGWHIARRIHQYVKALSPFSRTPYMLCPIGFDFVEPIPDLISLLDRYNREYYPKTGIWVVNAGLDDYLALIENYRDRLPVLELDPNPYWTGFYTSRPKLKKRCYLLLEKLLLAEKLAFLPENRGAEKRILQELEEPWWCAAVSNHHDFITGTSTDRVVEGEQIPCLERAIKTADEVIENLTPPLKKEHKDNGLSPPKWFRDGDKILIETAHYRIEIGESRGGAITDLRFKDGVPLLTGVSNDLVSYRDSGGLWRMGYEFLGGVWKESMKASNSRVKVEVVEHDGAVEILSSTLLNGEEILGRIWLENDSPLIYFRVEGKMKEGYSLIVRFMTTVSSERISMHAPGGVVDRPWRRIYNPTFWPLHRFAHIRDDSTGHGIAILQPFPGAISYSPDGKIELVAMRSAVREKAFGILGIPGNPVSAHKHERYEYEYAVLFTKRGDWKENKIHLLAKNLSTPWREAEEKDLLKIADSVVEVDPPDVEVVAVKPASRGEGVIVRLYAPFVPEKTVKIKPSFGVAKAFLCDARERDVEGLKVENNSAFVKMPGSIATIRLIPEERCL
ncbi:glycoside hydrolase family 38 C-terminal domain-containing protein [Thermococcus sp. MAR1]|uniref:glycoside hydrolase family 38 N-terminal domain-containing protein n=1 Tax=Thermococcus sp. MAR1 TaxID=1638263 RepID=UPI001F105086|nr:glycoside hydrolase family 38 C-terminal domain-containing protein [Thermococcus sp. MAR1]